VPGRCGHPDRDQAAVVDPALLAGHAVIGVTAVLVLSLLPVSAG
jgi:hypothetical protein